MTYWCPYGMMPYQELPLVLIGWTLGNGSQTRFTKG